MVLSLLSDEDHIMVSLTCSYFFRLLAPAVQQILASDLGPWAGDRLIFAGSYADGYPEGIATSAEKKIWGAPEGNGTNPGFSLYGLTSTAETEGLYLRLVAFYDFGRMGCKRITISLLEHVRAKVDSTASEDIFERLLKLLAQPESPAGPEATAATAVLRNLTTKEYVRDAALAASHYAYSLGEVVAIYTQWTQDPSGLEGLDTIGEWAGHRFDISDASHVLGDEWTDVSDQALARLATVTRMGAENGRRVEPVPYY